MKFRLAIFLILIILLKPIFAIPAAEVFLESDTDEIPYSPVVGDVNSDGHPEIVICSIDESEDNGWVTVMQKLPPPAASDAVDTLWSMRKGRGCFTPAIADVNGDGLGEIYCDAYFDSPGGMGVLCIDAVSGTNIWSTDIGGTYTSNKGHELLLADYDGDGEIEVISQQNRSSSAYDIVILDALTGAEEDRISTGSAYAYGSMICEDINDDGRNELIACLANCTSGDCIDIVVWDNSGTELWRDDGGPPALADVDLDGEPEIVVGWVDSSNRYHLYVYSHDGVLEHELMVINSSSTYFCHYESPVIADFDLMTPEPEIAFAVNHTPSGTYCIITVIHIDGTIFWQTPAFDHGEIISMSGADLSCDGIWDLCSYNMAGEFIVFDGASGVQWATFDYDGDYLPDPNRFVAIADVDYDCHAEFLVSTYRGGSSSSVDRGIYIYGDDDEWNPVRRLWNTGSYYYTNVDDRLRMNTAEVSEQHWEVDNIWRAQRVIPCGLEIIPGPELISDPIQCAECDSIGRFHFSARVWNPTCEEIAHYVNCVLDFGPAGDGCLNYLSGQCTTFLGDLYPETDTIIEWTFEIDPNCDSTDISFWMHATCLNSTVVDNRHLFVPVWTPRCHYPPGVVRVRPYLCGEVLACGPNDSLGTTIHTGQEIIFNIAADTILSNSYPLDMSSITLNVDSRHTSQEMLTLVDSRLTWQGSVAPDTFQGALFYNPDPLYDHGDTVVFTISSVYNELGCFTESDPCSFIVDDMYPDTIDVNPDHESFVDFTMIDSIWMVMEDDFVGINPESFDPNNTSITINSTPLTGYTIDARIDGINPDTIFFHDVDALPGDTVEICIWDTYDAVDDSSFCGANRTPEICYWFLVLADAPIAAVQHPAENTYSACVDQKIIFQLSTTAPMDSMSFELEIDSVVYDITEEWLWWDPDSQWIYWTPDDGWWQNGNQANVCLNTAANRVGQNFIDAPLCFNFWIDYQPPQITFISPPMGVSDMLRDSSPRLVMRIEDPLSGLNEDSLWLYVEGDRVNIPPAQLENAGDGIWNLTLTPEAAGIEFTPGDTISVEIKACDTPDYCAANCTTVTDSFIVEPKVTCLVAPNPFTPNGDNINDYTSFNYPHMYTEQAELVVFDIQNREVFRKEIGPVNDVTEYFKRKWDGKDNNGELMREGLYIYVIKLEGEVICNGTVIIAR